MRKRNQQPVTPIADHQQGSLGAEANLTGSFIHNNMEAFWANPPTFLILDHLPVLIRLFQRALCSEDISANIC